MGGATTLDPLPNDSSRERTKQPYETELGKLAGEGDVTNSALTEEGGTIPITKRISGAETANIYTCHVVVAKGRSYNCELLPDLSRTTLPRLPCGATGISTNATALCVVGTVHRFSLLFSFLLLGLLLLLLRRNQRSLLLYHQADKIYTCMRHVFGNDRRLVDICLSKI